MITDQDMQLSKISYTNKDFGSIYPELLDLAKKLTTKWDPSLSNESDPGVVLLKEGAFIADHNNYNIDKNILENFLPSATQVSSVSNILEMNGYSPRYYVSGTCNISFLYDPTKSTDEEETEEETTTEEEEFIPFVIPKYSLVVSNYDGTVTYTQISNLPISAPNQVSQALFIEGTLTQFKVDGDPNILLENLDDNNRLYFPSIRIAQNGVFIKSEIKNKTVEWERVDYLLPQKLGSAVYKVGFDSGKNLPYIEFPSDIATIIGSGLQIWYITSMGASGNVQAKLLTEVTSTTGEDLEISGLTISVSKLTAFNPSAVLNGKDPETIDEMYLSFKDIVGTFDTLVTRTDYKNAINQLKSGVVNNDNGVVSNNYVTDINTDYNHSLIVAEKDQYGVYFEQASISKGIVKYTFKTTTPTTPQPGDIWFTSSPSPQFNCKFADGSIGVINLLTYDEFTSAAQLMSPYDLYIYALRAFNIENYTFEETSRDNAINESFKPQLLSDVYQEIVSGIEDYKCINHVFKLPGNGDVFMFKNYVPLYIAITPYNKVSKVEREEILNSVYKALTLEFNSSKVAFGSELSYDYIVLVLLNADTRIKNIRLENLVYNPVAVVKDNSTAGYQEIPLYPSKNGDWNYTSTNRTYLIELIAKNVLAGRVCLFNFDDELLQPKLGELSINITPNIKTISTETKIPIQLSSELVGTESQSYYTETTYIKSQVASYINIKFNNAGVSGKTIAANGGQYALQTGDKIYVKLDPNSGEEVIYLNSNSVENGLSINYTLINNSNSAVTIHDDYVETGNINNDVLSIYYQLKNFVALVRAVVKPEENEFVTVSKRNYSSTRIYPTYVYFRFVSTDLSKRIPADIDYVLQLGESLTLLYDKQDEVYVSPAVYTAGDVIRSNFVMPVTGQDSSRPTYNKKYINNIGGAVYGTDGNGVPFDLINSGEQIEYRELLKSSLSGQLLCYWVKNNSDNNLFPDEITSADQYRSTILESGEYFIYTNTSKDSLVIFGAGTELQASTTLDSLFDPSSIWKVENKLTIEAIEKQGVNSELNWVVLNFDTTQNYFYAQERLTVTAGEGDTLEILDGEMNTTTSSGEVYIDNSWRLIELCLGGKLRVKYTSVDGSEQTISANSDGFLIRSRLDINTDTDKGLFISKNTAGNHIQLFIITPESGSPIPLPTPSSQSNGINIKTSIPISLYGGENININNLTKNNLQVKDYSKTDCTLSTASSESAEQLISSGSAYVVPITKNCTANFPVHINTNDYLYIMPVLVNTVYTGEATSRPADITFSISREGNLDLHIAEFPNAFTGSTSQSLSLSEDKLYLIQVKKFLQTNIFNCTVHVTITNFDSTVEAVTTVYVYEPVIVPYTAQINKKLTCSDIFKSSSSYSPERPVDLTEVTDKIKDLIASTSKTSLNPYYINVPDKELAIQDENMADANIFWDVNNVVNHMTIPLLDFKNSNIDIIKSMRNYND